ncbi:MAG TPA: SAM-dependent methyltransferase [Chloroflexaceae bacterium]|nr:SAM-dependent methyltransferase [Chloroflexaceae bacterium]
MDLETFDWLLGPEGQAMLAELAAQAPAEADALRALEGLRRRVAPERARAALEVALARRRARGKLPHAERLYFTREALEQASAGPVAAHRAARLAPYGEVADLCCGAGADALAIAAAGARVLAVDRDPLRLALCRANAAALGLAERVATLERALLAEPPPPAPALFCDPGRRAGGRRRFSVSEYEPPLAHVLGWRERTPALGVKLGPGVDRAELPADAEHEFVSLDGELKEAALWCGPLATVARRATVLKSAADGQAETHSLAASGNESPSSFILPPASFLYEPDPAVIRAGLVTDLGERLGAGQLDPQIAYLTAPDHVATPFARAWPLLAWLPFGLKQLRARLHELGAGAVTVKKRGSPLDSDALARRLSRPGGRPLVVVLTQASGRPAALICEPVLQ